MPEYGTLLGLAQSFDADQRINDLYRQEEANNRAKAMAEAKAKMFADDVKYHNAANPYDAKKLSEFAQGEILSLGDWVNKNPDYTYNPQKRIEYNKRVDRIKNNEHSIRAIASDKALSELKADLAEMAKNPELYDQEAYDQLLAEAKNYETVGNQKGIDAAAKEGAQPFIYRKPKNFVSNLAEDLMKAGSNVHDFNVKTINDYGGWYSEPKQDQIDALKAAKYQEHGRQLSVMARKNNWTPQQLDKYVEDNIRAGIKKDYNIGDINAGFNRWIQGERLKMDKAEFDAKYGDNQGAPYTTWDYINEPKNKFGRVNAKSVLEVYGDKPTIQVSGVDGTKLDLTGRKWQPDGIYATEKGQKFFSGYVDIPFEEAEQMGVYDGGSVWKGYTDKGINPQFSRVATEKTITDDKGEEHKFVRISAPIAINKNDEVARKKWEMATMPIKQVPTINRPSAGQNIQVDAEGNLFDVSSGTPKFIGKSNK